jgi:protocatechuate 3,4-dioxygenase beta subunit
VVDLDVAGVDPPFDHPEYVGTRLRAPKEPLVVVPHTLSELTGPAYGDTEIGELDNDLTRQHAGEPLGERIVVSGRVLGSDGRPLRGQLVEIWQANAAGRYRHEVDAHNAPLDPNFSGAGRTLTDADGRYRFVTVKPGAYFPDEVSANAADPLLSRLDPAARATLVAVAEDDGSLRFDIRLQGDGHTTFFAV